MGSLMGMLRGFVQLKILVKDVFSRYWRIITNLAKLIYNSFIVICVSLNYLAALVLIPAAVFYITHLITKEFIVPTIVSIIAIAIYLIVMSNYFSKGVHKFGAHAGNIKQAYHVIKMEHRLVLKELKEDAASGKLFILATAIIILEFVLMFYLFKKFNIGLKTLILIFVMVQIILLLGEYMLSGFGILKVPDLRRKEKVEEVKIPSNYRKSESFDELIVESEEEPHKKKTDMAEEE